MRALIFLFCAASAAGVLTQIPALPTHARTVKSLSVEINVWTPPRGWSDDQTTFAAPCDLHISAVPAMDPPAIDGDTVRIEYFANTRLLGTQDSRWMPEVNPSAHARPGQAVPMFIQRAQFSLAEFVWKNAPPGNYTMTARATFGQNPPAVSKSVAITILPHP